MPQKPITLLFNVVPTDTDGLFLDSPDIGDLQLFISDGDLQNMIEILNPALNLYLLTHYDLAVERCLIDLEKPELPVNCKTVLSCSVVPK